MTGLDGKSVPAGLLVGMLYVLTDIITYNGVHPPHTNSIT